MSAASSTPGPSATRRLPRPDAGAATSALALELIADLVRAPHLDEAELEREKEVVLSELGECLDAPDDLIHDHLFDRGLRRPAARPLVLGQRGEHRGDRRATTAWPGWSEQYRAGAAGHLAPPARSIPSHILLLAEALFGDLASTAPPRRRAGPLRRRHRSPTGASAEQAHLRLRLSRACPHPIPTAPALALFAQAVGGGMSSRLFQELREERGLAYSIYAWTQGSPTPACSRSTCRADKARAAEAMALARDIVERAAEDADRGRVRSAPGPRSKAGMLMALETPQGRADYMARSIEMFGRIMTAEEMLAELRAVDVDAARAAGRRCSTGRARIASIGGKLALAA